VIQNGVVITPVYTKDTKPAWMNWELHCDHCGKEGIKVAADMGQEREHDNQFAMVCLDCLREATKKLEALAG
jgi:hypothetical protein